MKKPAIGLLAAMPQESQALLRRVKGWKRKSIGAFPAYRFQLSGWDCWLVQSGIGLERARQAAQALLGAADMQLLVSFGTAGAVNSDLQIGDVVLARRTCMQENGSAGKFIPLRDLTEPAWRVLEHSLQTRGARLLSGTAITTRGSQLNRLPVDVPNTVLEMETYGIAQVAYEKGIPVMGLRSISDGPRSPIPFDLNAIMDEKYHFRVGKMLAAILRNPRILLQGWLMLQNSKTAAANAAIALLVVLEQQILFKG